MVSLGDSVWQRKVDEARDYCRESLVEASATPHAGLTPPSMMRKLSSDSGRGRGTGFGRIEQSRQRGNERRCLVVVCEFHDVEFSRWRIRRHAASVLIHKDLGEPDAGVLVISC